MAIILDPSLSCQAIFQEELADELKPREITAIPIPRVSPLLQSPRPFFQSDIPFAATSPAFSPNRKSHTLLVGHHRAAAPQNQDSLNTENQALAQSRSLFLWEVRAAVVQHGPAWRKSRPANACVQKTLVALQTPQNAVARRECKPHTHLRPPLTRDKLK